MKKRCFSTWTNNIDSNIWMHDTEKRNVICALFIRIHCQRRDQFFREAYVTTLKSNPRVCVAKFLAHTEYIFGVCNTNIYKQLLRRKGARHTRVRVSWRGPRWWAPITRTRLRYCVNEIPSVRRCQQSSGFPVLYLHATKCLSVPLQPSSSTAPKLNFREWQNTRNIKR